VNPVEFATIVDTKALFETAVAAVIAGVGVVFTFSLAILGAAQSSDASRDGRPGVAVAFGAMAVLGLLATLAAIVFGLVVMTSG